MGTLWNPYNVPIEFEAAFTHIDLQGIKWNFTRIKEDGSEKDLAIDPVEKQLGSNYPSWLRPM